MMLKSVEKSVVKVKFSKYTMAWITPWMYRDSLSGNGSGFCVETSIGKFIITNFHCISNYKDIIICNFAGEEFPGTVISHFASIDLAMISVPPRFWKNASCVKFTIPNKADKLFILIYIALINLESYILSG